MDLYITLSIFTVILPSTVSHQYDIKNLLQFENMIECMIPGSSPLLDFGDYGCYCGLGGEGLPVDQLDQCCFTHDSCYAKAKTLNSCSSVFDSPYTNVYEYQCDKINRRITCLASNNDCDMFICQCDKAAAECFSQSPYNSSNNHLPSRVCSSASRETKNFILNISTFIFTLTLLYSNTKPFSQ